MIKIVLVDDHKVFREGVSALISKEKDMCVVGEAHDELGLVELLQKKHVDIVIMDLDLAGATGIGITQKIKTLHPTINVLALSMHEEKEYVIKMLEAGASGYLLKNVGKVEMLAAIKALSLGDSYFSSEVSALLLRQFTKKDSEKENACHHEIPLTHREIEVLKLITEEYSNPEIAEKLFISIRTVDTHRRNLLEKLAVKNTAGLVKYALRHGLID